MLKESGRERINAVYGTKEQCRKEFQDEITRLRNQFQLVCSRKKNCVKLTCFCLLKNDGNIEQVSSFSSVFHILFIEFIKLAFDLANIISNIGFHTYIIYISFK